MAIYKIEETEGEYITITVSFQGRHFRQQLIATKTGDELNEQLQEYSDQYENDWLDIQTQAVTVTDIEIIDVVPNS